MMKAFESTNLPFLREDCEKEFAQPMGTRIFGRAQELYHELAAQADDKGNPAIAEHLRGKLLNGLLQGAVGGGHPQKRRAGRRQA